MKARRMEEVHLSTLLAVVILISSSISTFSFAFSGSPTPPARSLSNSGVILVEDAAATVIYGMDAPPPGDLIGSYIWTGDLNDDGIDDIGFSSTTDGETRGVNFIYGERGGFPDFIDLASPSSVSFSINYPARQIDAGDVDHDGIKDLILAGQLIGRAYPGTGSGFDEQNIVGIQSGVHQQTWEYPYNDFIWSGDIDGDSLDDQVLGTFGCGAFLTAGIYQPDEINIRWSESGNMTTFTADKWDDFASSIGIGDIDGDGSLDMAVGVPKADPEEGPSRQFGAVCVYFNITRFDNSTTFHPYEVADTIIYGSDTYDQFGWNVIVKDINGDGKDDILTGAPNSGGVQNQKPGCGEILIYYGKDNRSFPALMDAENTADIILIGATGRITDPVDYEGDKIGRLFQLSDMDGNGALEISISTPYRTLDPIDGVARDRAGSISLYELKKVIPKIGKIATLGYPSKTFTIEARDMGDSLGWQVRVGDVNGDDFDDLLIGVPGADGFQNGRRNCGEIYIILGEGTRLTDCRISGPGSSTPKLFTMGGTIDINLSYESSRGYDQIIGGELVLGSGPVAVSIVFENGSFKKENDTYDSIFLHPEGCGLGGSGMLGWLNFRMELSWHFPFEGPIDVTFSLKNLKNNTVTRTYPSSAVICKDILMTSDIKVFNDHGEVMMLGTYLAPHEKGFIRDSRIVYQSDPLREVPFQTLWISHLIDGTFNGKVQYERGWSVEFDTPDTGIVDHNLVPSISSDTYPESTPPEYLPDTGLPVLYRCMVDPDRPLSPTGLKAFSKDGNNENISRTGDFTLSWDVVDLLDGDHGLSGIREYWVSVNDDEPDLALTNGGLMGTYYSDIDSYQREKEVLDETLHFTINDWGPFGPDPNLFLPDHYSVSWWGWLDMGGAKNQFFKLIGSGDARVYLDGNRIMDWTPIKKGVVIGGYDFEEGEDRRIEILFRHRTGDSFFSFLYQDESGSFSPVPSDALLHPTNTMPVRIGSSIGSVKVLARDWVGHYSQPASIDLFRDSEGPLFDLSGIDRWASSMTPSFNVEVWDADPVSSPFSGLDPDSVRYRLQDEWGALSDWFEPSKVSRLETDPDRYAARIEPKLTRDWNGEVQLRASDLEGNNGLSPMVELGVDMRPPEIIVLQPASGETIEGSKVEIKLRATDFKGSGFDGNSLQFMKNVENSWSNWTDIPFDVKGQEVLMTENFDLPFGMVELRFRGSDLMGNRYQTPSFFLTMKVPVINRKPVPVIKTPLNNTVFDHGVPVYLSSEGTSDDGLGEYSPVRLTWISSIQGILGNERFMDVNLRSGSHKITLYADDGAPGHNVSVSVNITVLDPPDPNGTGPLDPIDDDEWTWTAFIITFFIMILIVIAVMVIMVILSRRREDKETQLWVIEETSDDREYRKSKNREDRDRGYTMEYDDDPDQ